MKTGTFLTSNAAVSEGFPYSCILQKFAACTMSCICYKQACVSFVEHVFIYYEK